VIVLALSDRRSDQWSSNLMILAVSASVAIAVDPRRADEVIK